MSAFLPTDRRSPFSLALSSCSILSALDREFNKTQNFILQGAALPHSFKMKNVVLIYP
jgi:hypothetical protein